MSTSAVGSVLDTIVAALKALSGLTGVNVFSGPVGAEEAGREWIIFDEARLVEVAAAMGGNREETWDVDGALMAAKPWQGTTELSIEAARDRALAILAEIETHLNDTYTGNLPDVELTNARLTQDFGPEGRSCLIEFTFRLLTIKNP